MSFKHRADNKYFLHTSPFQSLMFVEKIVESEIFSPDFQRVSRRTVVHVPRSTRASQTNATIDSELLHYTNEWRERSGTLFRHFNGVVTLYSIHELLVLFSGVLH